MRFRAAVNLLRMHQQCQPSCEQLLQHAKSAVCVESLGILQDGPIVVHICGQLWPNQVSRTVVERQYSASSAASLQQKPLMLQSAGTAGHLQQQQQLRSGLRYYSQEELRTAHAEISENEYHHLADEVLEHLQEKLEEFIEDLSVEGGDVEHAQGVLTVKLGGHGTYVINKQTPNKQIWWSSPVSGPLRYDYRASDGCWVYHRDGRELLSLLEQELQSLLGRAPKLQQTK